MIDQQGVAVGVGAHHAAGADGAARAAGVLDRDLLAENFRLGRDGGIRKERAAGVVVITLAMFAVNYASLSLHPPILRSLLQKRPDPRCVRSGPSCLVPLRRATGDKHHLGG